MVRDRHFGYMGWLLSSLDISGRFFPILISRCAKDGPEMSLSSIIGKKQSLHFVGQSQSK